MPTDPKGATDIHPRSVDTISSDQPFTPLEEVPSEKAEVREGGVIDPGRGGDVFISDKPTGSATTGVNAWPPFIDEKDFRRYLVSEDGKVRLDRLEARSSGAPGGYSVRAEFVDENNLPAGELTLWLSPDLSNPGFFVCHASRIDMFKRGGHYGFEIFVQAIRYLHSNPDISQMDLTAVETGRYVWKHFDGFRLKLPYLKEAHDQLRWLNDRYHLGLTDEVIQKADTPSRFSRIIDLYIPHPELLDLAREAYRGSGRSVEEILQKTRYPGELVLLALQSQLRGNDYYVDYRYETSLDFRSEAAVKAFERSVDDFWRVTRLNPRSADQPHRRVKVYSDHILTGEPEEVWGVLKNGKLFLEAKRGQIDWDSFVYDGDGAEAGLWINGRFFNQTEYAVVNGSRKGDAGQYVVHLEDRRVIGSLDTGRAHPGVIGDPDFILYPDMVDFAGRSWAVNTETGKVSATRVYQLSSFLPLVTGMTEFYNPETGVLSFPLSGNQKQADKIDLNIPGVDEKCQISVEKSADRKNFHHLVFSWGQDRALKIDFDSMENTLHVNAEGLNLRGFRFQYGRGATASVAGLKELVTDFMARVRWGYVPSYAGIFRTKGSSAATTGGAKSAGKPAGPEPAGGGSGVTPPSDAGGSGGGGPLDPVERSRRIGHQLRPLLVAEMIPLPPLSERKLDQGEILRMALTKKYLMPGVLHYDRLGDSYRLNEAKNIFEKSGEGIRTWGDLLVFIETALQHAKDGEQIEVKIRQYEFPTLIPTPDFLAGVTGLALAHPEKSITLVVSGDPLDPPAIYRFDKTGVHASTLERDEEAIGFWERGKGRDIFEQYFLHRRAESVLAESMRQAHDEMPESNLGLFLARAIALYNEKAIGEILPIPHDRLTEIFSRLSDFCERIADEAKIALNWKAGEVPPSALYWDPITTLLRAHPADLSPKNGWFSIGAGQMVATLEFPRRLVDEGVLPLDFRLGAVDMNQALVWETNEEGTNRIGLGKQPVNELDRRPIYVLGGAQRDEALLTYRPDVVLLNLKASYLSRVVDGRLIGILGPVSPVLATPAKAYDDTGGLPYLDLYSRLHRAGLALTVMGGFFAAPQILKGEKVDMTLASESAADLLRLARGMSPAEVSETGRANCDWLNLKLIANRELAAALMAGGANKNFLTYRSARRLMRWALDLPPTASEPELNEGDKLLAGEKAHNIQAGEEITARIVPVYGISTDHLWSPKGLKEDFRNCLPPTMAGIHRIAAALRKIMAPVQIGPLHDPQTLTQIAEENVMGLAQVIRASLEFGAEASLADPDFLRAVGEQIREGILSETDLLIEAIRNGLGGGTRNARDGYIDEVIAEVYKILGASGYIDENVFPFSRFYQEHYPEKWKGAGAQEGRNGIGPLIQFAEKNGITLPPEVYKAWSLYHPEAPIDIPGERRRAVALAEGVEIDPVWGLPVQWMRRIKLGILGLDNALTRAVYEGTKPDNDFMKSGIDIMRKVLGSIGSDTGVFPEVVRRMLAIKQRLEILYQLFDGGHRSVGMSEEEWNGRLEKYAIVKFRQSVEQIQTVLKGEESFTVTKLLTHLRRLTIRLYKVELAMRQEIAVEFDLTNNGDAAEIVSLPPRGASSALGIEAAVEGGTHPATSIVSPMVAPSSDGGTEPKASLAGFDPVWSGGIFYAGDLPESIKPANNNLFYGAMELIVDGNTVKKVPVDTAEETRDQGPVTSDMEETSDMETAEDGGTAADESGLFPSVTGLSTAGLPRNVLFYPGVSPATVARSARVLSIVR
ncbi:MAG: hypothetical protein HY541_00360 [Deltaproteobacteria bacterium]|nr:hypothetical protein [Deltaproteobacteria bacterium]